jgi:uncharacterized NAD(P)/FAD-binding protein YdhS
MVAAGAKFLAAGTRVEIAEPGPVPHWSTWDDDKQRTSTPVKKRLQQMFFKGDRRIRAEIVYISSESERERMKTRGLVKLQIKDPAGSLIVITAGASQLRAVG